MNQFFLLFCIGLVCVSSVVSAQKIDVGGKEQPDSLSHYALEYAIQGHFDKALFAVERKKYLSPADTEILIREAHVYLLGKESGLKMFDSAGYKAQRAIVRALSRIDIGTVINALMNVALPYPSNSCRYVMAVGKMLYALDMPSEAQTFFDTAAGECSEDSLRSSAKYWIAQSLLNTTWLSLRPGMRKEYLRDTAGHKAKLMTALGLLNESRQLDTTNNRFGILGEVYEELAMLNDSNRAYYEALSKQMYRAAVVGSVKQSSLHGFTDTVKSSRLPDFEIKDTGPSINLRALAQQVGYPPAARNARISGKIHARAYINRRGKAQSVIVYTQDAGLFEEAIEKAVLNAQFIPALEGSVPVGCLLTIPFAFRFR